MGRTKSVLGVLLAVLLLLAGAGIAGAAPKMVIDRSHGQTADLSGFASVLVSRGWEVVGDQVDEIVPLTTEVLNACNLLVVPQPVSSDFTDEEVALVRAYVEAGGGLWVLYDVNYNPLLGEFPPTELPPNTLPAAFGKSFTAAAVVDFTDGPSIYEPRIFVSPVADADYAPLFAEVSSFLYLQGVYLKDVDAVPPLPAGSEFPAVLAIGDGGYSDDYVDSGALPVFAAGKVGEGKVVFIGDMTPLASDVYPDLESGNKQLLHNIVAWAMKPVSVPNEPEAIEVMINLRPWNPRNKINLNARGFVRVAVMSTEGFNAADVDPNTVEFAGAKPVCSKVKKVNRDRLKDLVLVFWIPDLRQDSDNPNGLTCDPIQEAVLTGKTKDDKTIQGSDTVNVVQNSYCWKPPKNNKCGGKKGK